MAVYSGPNSVENGLILALDAGNKKSFSPNVFPKGTDIYGWYVDTLGNNTANNCNLTRDTISSPVGNTPLKMSVTGDDPYLVSYNTSPWNLANAASGESWTISVYVKASQSTTGQLLVFGAGSNSQYLEVPNTTVNITTSWTRVSYTATFSNASTVFLQMRLDGTNSGGSGIDIWWDGLQIERGSTATEFTKEYTLDSSLNERMLDLSGKTNNGTLTNGPTYSSGNGGSIVFDGSDDYVQKSSTTLDLSSGVTMEMIFKSTDMNSRAQGFIQFNAGGYFVNFYTPGNGKLRWETWVPVSTAGGSYFTPTALSNNTWYHALGTYTNGSSVLYINGTSVASASQTAGTYSSSFTANIRVGEYAGYMSGNIAIAKMYNRALSAAEVQQNFTALRGRFGI